MLLLRFNFKRISCRVLRVISITRARESFHGGRFPRVRSSRPYILVAMNPRSRAAVVVGTAVALTIPYIAFVVYFSFRFPKNHWPVWVTDVLLVWFIANFVAIYLMVRRMAKKQPPQNVKTPMQLRKASAGVWILRAFGSYLVLVWGVLFLYGVKGTVRGEYPLSRAIPAGAFLLSFILLFGWAIYRSFRPKA